MRARVTGLLIITTLALGLAPSAAGAGTITVTATGDDDPSAPAENNNGSCTLREAIREANNDGPTLIPDCTWAGTLGDDTITLNAGTYVLDETGAGDDSNVSGDLDVDTDVPFADSLTIDGAGVSSTIIDPTAGWDDRIFHQTPTGTETLTISDISMSQGAPAGGGSSGGAISSQGGDLVLTRVRVNDNDSNQDGGGVYASGDSLKIEDSEVAGNDAASGGGVLSIAGTTTIDSSLVFGNSALNLGGTQGGGIYVQNTALTVTDSIIQGNDASEGGASTAEAGGLVVLNGSAMIRGTEISENQLLSVNGGNTGAGVRFQVTDPSYVVNSTITDNHAYGLGSSGGGVTVSGGTVNFSHTTFGPNQGIAGGVTAIQQTGGTVNVRGSIIETSEIDTGPACGGTITSQGYNVFTDDTCGTLIEGDEENADPLLGALEDNGGPDAGAPGTFLEPIRSHLPADNSTAVEHVPQANCLDLPSGFLTVDQRGLGRPEDFDENGTAVCDAGSVELQLPEPPAPTGKCAGKAATIVGSDAGETIKGTSKRDIVDAKGGNDTVKGLGGNDLLCGGKGKDKLIGGKGKDTLRGDAGKDTLNGGAGKDSLKGGSKKDLCKGGGAKDKASGCETRRTI